jgi:hypothetical protein
MSQRLAAIVKLAFDELPKTPRCRFTIKAQPWAALTPALR